MIEYDHLVQPDRNAIGDNETAGGPHERLMEQDAMQVLQTVQAVKGNETNAVPQVTLINAEEHAGRKLQEAPKIFKEDCLIDWNKSLGEVHNFIRGLSPSPAAFTKLSGKTLKLFRSRKEEASHNAQPGTFFTRSEERRVGKEGV